MIRRPPRPTLTDTLFPYTTLFRSDAQVLTRVLSARVLAPGRAQLRTPGEYPELRCPFAVPVIVRDESSFDLDREGADGSGPTAIRSEERRVGKECVSTCRSRWSPYH